VQNIPVLVTFLAGHGAELVSVVPQHATLEEIYLKIQDQEGQVPL